jgi:hypothetical protein
MQRTDALRFFSGVAFRKKDPAYSENEKSPLDFSFSNHYDPKVSIEAHSSVLPNAA